MTSSVADRCPPEIWHKIFLSACTDAGATRRALCLTSRRFKTIAEQMRVQYVAVCNDTRLQALSKAITSHRLDPRHIRQVLIDLPDEASQTLLSRLGIPSKDEIIRTGFRWQIREHPQPWKGICTHRRRCLAVMDLLTAVAPVIESLSLPDDALWWFPAVRICCPVLHTLTMPWVFVMNPFVCYATDTLPTLRCLRILPEPPRCKAVQRLHSILKVMPTIETIHLPTTPADRDFSASLAEIFGYSADALQHEDSLQGASTPPLSHTQIPDLENLRVIIVEARASVGYDEQDSPKAMHELRKLQQLTTTTVPRVELRVLDG